MFTFFDYFLSLCFFYYLLLSGFLGPFYVFFLLYLLF